MASNCHVCVCVCGAAGRGARDGGPPLRAQACAICVLCCAVLCCVLRRARASERVPRSTPRRPRRARPPRASMRAVYGVLCCLLLCCGVLSGGRTQAPLHRRVESDGRGAKWPSRGALWRSDKRRSGRMRGVAAVSVCVCVCVCVCVRTVVRIESERRPRDPTRRGQALVK